MRYQAKVFAGLMICAMFSTLSSRVPMAFGALPQSAASSTEILSIPAFILTKTACYGRLVPKFALDNDEDFSRGDPKPFIQKAHMNVAGYSHQLCLEKIGQTSTGEMWMRHSVESVTLKNGHAFVVDSMGWDAMGTRYTFVVRGAHRPFSDYVYWHKRTAELLEEIATLTSSSSERAIIFAGVKDLQGQEQTGTLSVDVKRLANINATFTGTAFWSDSGTLPTGGSWFQLVLAGGGM